MDKKDKNIVDKFLDNYEAISNNRVRYKRIYQKPSKFKSIIGFIFSIILTIMMLLMFVAKLMYFVLLLGVILTGVYYGINLFTEKGIGLPKRIPINENEDREESE